MEFHGAHLDTAGAFRAIHNFKFHPPFRPLSPSSPWLNPLREFGVSPLNSASSPGPTGIRPAQCISSACGHPRPSEPGARDHAWILPWLPVDDNAVAEAR
jgi:hypothetical protein